MRQSRHLVGLVALLMVLVTACGGDGGAAISLADASGVGTATSTAAPTATASATEAALDTAALASSPPVTVAGVPPPEISAAAAIVIDDGSLAVLYERNAHDPHEPASVTKIATAILAAEHSSMETVVTSDLHHWDLVMEDDSSTMGLEPGDRFTMRDLLLGLMLVSGNDAAIAIGRHLAGTDQQFVDAMNVLAARLGLHDTHFMNAHGLSQPGHVSTAYDLALLSRHLMSIPALREIVGTEEITVTGTTADGEPRVVELYNHNPLLNYTPGVDGVKTGFTENAGRTFSVTAERDGHRVYAVLLDAPDRAQDSIALIEWAFAAHEWPE